MGPIYCLSVEEALDILAKHRLQFSPFVLHIYIDTLFWHHLLAVWNENVSTTNICLEMIINRKFIWLIILVLYIHDPQMFQTIYQGWCQNWSIATWWRNFGLRPFNVKILLNIKKNKFMTRITKLAENISCHGTR